MPYNAEITAWPRTADFEAESVPVKVAPLPFHDAGLSYTASGYGRRIPTRFMVHVSGRWHRVYLCQFSNAGSAYIGPSKAWTHTVDIWETD